MRIEIRLKTELTPWVEEEEEGEREEWGGDGEMEAMNREDGKEEGENKDATAGPAVLGHSLKYFPCWFGSLHLQTEKESMKDAYYIDIDFLVI